MDKDGNQIPSCGNTLGGLPDPNCRLFIEHIIHGIMTEFEKKTGGDIAAIRQDMTAIRIAVDGVTADMAVLKSKQSQMYHDFYDDDKIRDKVRDHAKLIKLLGSVVAALSVGAISIFANWLQGKLGVK
jgi:hypothetical protein